LYSVFVVHFDVQHSFIKVFPVLGTQTGPDILYFFHQPKKRLLVAQ
jgi:hypothetical protein